MNSGDMRLNAEAIRRMLAEQVEDSRDGEILRGYKIGDLDKDSFNTYRSMYSARQPDHPWNKIGEQEFLYQIGAWANDRETGHTGITRAGLLMFGQYRPIMEAFPHYMLDYQEKQDMQEAIRWIDRIVPDGSWSGNIFDFYARVIRRLTADVKVPFELKKDVRQDQTPVHTALREALVNTLIHADYTGRVSILVEKRPDVFSFRNPGLMRVSLAEAMQGGQSDCRNRTLQNMFRFIGLGENAGSGLSKIFEGWKSQHWRKPLLREITEPSEQTLLELHALSLIPQKVLHALRVSLGEENFHTLGERERLILVTAKIEKTLDHKRMMQILDIHPRDLSALLSNLVDRGFLHQEGIGRGTIYFLEEARLQDEIEELPMSLDPGCGGLEPRSGGLEPRSGGLEPRSRESETEKVSSYFGNLWQRLLSMASPVSSKKKASKEVVRETILSLCALHPCTLEELARLLNRSSTVIRKDYLQPLIQERKLRYRFPTKPNHPEQAYISIDEQEK